MLTHIPYLLSASPRALAHVQIARRFIEWAGYQVDVVMDGQQCIDKVKENPPYALILMDCQMPNVDGYEATKAIRDWEKQQVKETGTQRRETPIIAMTAYTMPEDQEKCLDEVRRLRARFRRVFMCCVCAVRCVLRVV